MNFIVPSKVTAGGALSLDNFATFLTFCRGSLVCQLKLQRKKAVRQHISNYERRKFDLTSFAKTMKKDSLQKMKFQ